jgi:SNF2 family DNA or RNA helicase
MNAQQPWTPRVYQLAALQWLVENPHSGLLLDPGLGKTSTTLAAIDFLLDEEHIHHTLVVAPLRVAKTVWPVEVEKWSDFNRIDVCVLCEMTTEERIELLRKKHDVYVINPESLINLLAIDPWRFLNFDMLVIDESTKFKDTQTKRFKALKAHLHKFARRVVLTGTPAPNGLADLFGQVYICDLGAALGRFITHFRQRYMYQSRDGFTWLLAPGAEARIYEAVKPLLLRMMAVDYLDMPELINNYIDITLPPGIGKMYKELERNFLLSLQDATIPVFNTAALGTKLRQVANGFIYDEDHKSHYVHNEKLKALIELVEEMQGRPLIVCYEFIEDANLIEANFPEAVNVSKRKDTLNVVNDFNAGRIPLLIGHPRSMGHGLNLQEVCKDICWYGITWDLELYQQAIARIWRQGQPSPVVEVHHIVALDTKDVDVSKTLAEKDVVQSRLNAALKTLPDNC